MSYDIWLRGKKCDYCKVTPPAPDCPNPTYNLTAIFDLALTGEPLPNPDVGEAGVVLLHEKTDRPRGLRVLSGRPASDTVPMIEGALWRLGDPTMLSQFVALEPPNKWGTHRDAVVVMTKLMELARTHLDYTWEIQ